MEYDEASPSKGDPDQGWENCEDEEDFQVEEETYEDEEEMEEIQFRKGKTR